jgi:hypothetical protein
MPKQDSITNKQNKAMNAISTLTSLPTTPAERRQFIEMAKTEIVEGRYKITEVFPVLKSINTLVDELTKDQEFRDMLSQAINGRHEANGLEISEQTVRRYNCAECHDSVYNDLLTQMNSLKEQIKTREEFLRSIPASGMVNPDTGEMLYPPVATFETRFIVKQSKK